MVVLILEHSALVFNVVKSSWFFIDFSGLPTLSDPPTAENIGTTSVTLRWNVWNPDNGDTGDGPITAYNVYHQLSETPVASELHPVNPSQTEISSYISSLNPNTEYHFYVKVERYGPGGEGPASPTVTVRTLTSAITPTEKTGATLEPSDVTKQDVTSGVTTKG